MSQFIKLLEVAKRAQLSGSTIYRLASKGEFPKPIKLTPGGRSSAWIAEEVDQWVEERIQASRAEEVA